MLVGGPLAGKTTVLEVLAETLISLNQKGFDEDKVRIKFPSTRWGLMFMSCNCVPWFQNYFIEHEFNC